MERDEAAKQIRFLQEQLKERERDKERDMRITSEVKLSLDTFFFKRDDNIFLLYINTICFFIITRCGLGLFLN